MKLITPSDVRWGSYSDFEGPVFYGRHPFTTPENPDEADKIISVISATEGANYSAVNMYDSMIISVGLIQFGEAKIFAVSDMLGKAIERAGESSVIDALEPALRQSNASFKKNKQGSWRFFFNDGRGEVKSVAQQQQLFLGCDGKHGSWTPTTRAYAKLWASSVANVWHDPDSQRAQVEYTRGRLNDFLDLDVKAELFNPDLEGDPRWIGAVRAAYLSFAANLPRVAGKQYRAAKAKLKSEFVGPNWCIGLIKQLTFGPNIGIYPGRYDKIRPVLEKLWDIELPKTSKELGAWKEPPRVEVNIEIGPIEQVVIPEIKEEQIEVPEPVKEVQLPVEEKKPTDDLVVFRDSAPPSFISLIISFIQMIISLLFKKKD